MDALDSAGGGPEGPERPEDRRTDGPEGHTELSPVCLFRSSVHRSIRSIGPPSDPRPRAALSLHDQAYLAPLGDRRHRRRDGADRGGRGADDHRARPPPAGRGARRAGPRGDAGTRRHARGALIITVAVTRRRRPNRWRSRRPPWRAPWPNPGNVTRAATSHSEHPAFAPCMAYQVNNSASGTTGRRRPPAPVLPVALTPP